MCSIDSKHSLSISLTSYFCKVFHPIKIGMSFSLYLFSIPRMQFHTRWLLRWKSQRKHAFYHFKKSVAFDLLIWFWLANPLFFTLTPMYFFNIYPKSPPILRDNSIAHPSLSQNNNLAGLRVFIKIFNATKVPKSFKIFGTKPTFL